MFSFCLNVFLLGESVPQMKESLTFAAGGNATAGASANSLEVRLLSSLSLFCTVLDVPRGREYVWESAYLIFPFVFPSLFALFNSTFPSLTTSGPRGFCVKQCGQAGHERPQPRERAVQWLFLRHRGRAQQREHQIADQCQWCQSQWHLHPRADCCR